MYRLLTCRHVNNAIEVLELNSRRDISAAVFLLHTSTFEPKAQKSHAKSYDKMRKKWKILKFFTNLSLSSSRFLKDKSTKYSQYNYL
jgi:hypothetical protein